jgi:hypothetical protein
MARRLAVQVAAGGRDHGEAIEPELTQVDPVPLSESGELIGGDDHGVAPAEDELALSEGAAGEHAKALRSCVADLHVPDHRTSALVEPDPVAARVSYG